MVPPTLRSGGVVTVCRVGFGFVLNSSRPGEAVGPKDDADIGEQIGGEATLEILPDAWAFTDEMGVLAEHEDADEGEA
jgi:hypothetical protein